MHKATKIILVVATVLLSLLLAAGIAFALILEPNIRIDDWERLDENRLTKIERTLTLLDDDDNLISDVIYDNNKIYTAIDRISRQTIDAFISIEDKRFYRHHGIDYLRILSAVKANLFSKSFKEGASTISQQLIKNTHLGNEKTIRRKIKEMRIARDLERHFTKNEILEMYLNILYFGNNMYGIGTAARVMFDKNVEQLTLPESALLAGMINNPSSFSPYKNADNALTRRNLVLRQMRKNKRITEEEYAAAAARPIEVKNNSDRNHYIDSVLREAAEILGCDEEDLFLKNYTIGTYYDARLQTEIAEKLRSFRLPDDSIETHALVVDNRQRIVVAEGGKSTRNLAALRRSPGSTIKPVLCYAPALEKKLVTPVTPILDEKMSFGNYHPNNYRNKYYGWVSVEDSLASSLNIPAVRLLEMCGVPYAKQTARKFGLPFHKEDHYLGMALGGLTKGFTLKELASAYSAFAAGGLFGDTDCVRYILDAHGKTVYLSRRESKRAVSADTAYLVTNMLQKCASEGTAKRLAALNLPVAAKTGTVGGKDGNTDAYCVAYTPSYTIAVWLGKTRGTMDNDVTGGGLPTSIARDILQNLPCESAFLRPASVVEHDIDLGEWENNHKVILASPALAPRFRKKALFSIYNLPKMPQQSVVEYEDKSMIDIDNFEILDGVAN